MRVIVVGASSLGLHLVEKLIKHKNEVILIEREEKKAENLAESLDCTVINAEGTRPAILEKAGITETDAIIACTDHDQDNIIIGLIARDYNVPTVILRIDDEQFCTVAKKIGFYHVIDPPQIASMIICDSLRGVDTIELSSLVRGDVRFISRLVTDTMQGKPLFELTLPPRSRFIGLYRENEFFLAEEDPVLKEGDEIIIVTREEYIKEVFAQPKSET
jgi:trk system potassium uptake protein TrkA